MRSTSGLPDAAPSTRRPRWRPIGVIFDAVEEWAVRELFQLFKTHWEPYVAGREYEVVVSSSGAEDRPRCEVLILYSSRRTAYDEARGINVERSARRTLAVGDHSAVPIYGEVASVDSVGHPVLTDSSGSSTVARSFDSGEGTVVRVGYDLFREIGCLLDAGQPVEHSEVPTLDLHITLLRGWIVSSGVPVLEIPPLPWGCSFTACLTHDIDFAGIRRQGLDRTMLGFLYRALLGSVFQFLRGRQRWRTVLANWRAALRLPLVMLGARSDFWDRFDEYASIEKGTTSTFFAIPFAGTPGERVDSSTAKRRATSYDIRDISDRVESLLTEGHEIGLHGIDAWHSARRAGAEALQIEKSTGQQVSGVRMHWLCFGPETFRILDQAGLSYDSTFGYNGAVGYRAGTTQVYQPEGCRHLLELPLHLQDTALFLSRRMAMSEGEAWSRYRRISGHATRFGGEVTLSWHLRSLGPERFWGDFYRRCLEDLRRAGCRFAGAAETVDWFRRRRAISFAEVTAEDATLRVGLDMGDAARSDEFTLRLFLPTNGEPAPSGDLPAHLDHPARPVTTAVLPRSARLEEPITMRGDR